RGGRRRAARRLSHPRPDTGDLRGPALHQARPDPAAPGRRDGRRRASLVRLRLRQYLEAVTARHGAVEVAGAPFAVVLALLFAFLAAKDGGFALTVWLPVAVFSTFLLAITLWSRRLPSSRPILWATGSLLAFVLVMFASTAWADVRGDAWAGAD